MSIQNDKAIIRTKLLTDPIYKGESTYRDYINTSEALCHQVLDLILAYQPKNIAIYYPIYNADTPRDSKKITTEPAQSDVANLEVAKIYREPDIMQLMKLSGMDSYNATDTKFSLPIIDKEEMSFAEYQLGDLLEKTQFPRLLQPATKLITIPDFMVIPAVALSTNGYRLGFGKGYYDKYFNKRGAHSHPITCNTVKVGVCFHNRLFERLPHEQHDLKLDYVITDKIIIKI